MASEEVVLGSAIVVVKPVRPRPPRVGDVIMGPLGAPVSREDTTMVDADVPATPSLIVDLSPVDLPADFTQRIRALPSSTILHVPASCRLRMNQRCGTVLEWHGSGTPTTMPSLTEGRSKLLLSTVPPGLERGHRGSEASHTFGRSKVLRRFLQRAEQASGANPVVRLTPLSEATARDAQQLVGAYRKATTGLVSSMLSFNEQEGVRWAQELLPTSNLGSSAHCGPHLAPPPALPESTWDRPFSGLHYAALTAPGPTGTRPEHITDLLNVPRRIHANKIHAALSALFCRISAGTLPPAARWLHTDTALLATQEERQTASHQDG